MRLHPFLFASIPIVLILNLFLSTYICIPPSLANADQNTSEIFCQECSQGTDTKIGVSDSVGVELTRPRWYGTIYEANNQKTLNLLGFGILLGCNGKNLEVLHLSTLAFVLFLLIMGIVMYKKEKVIVLR